MLDANAEYLTALARVKLTALEAIERLIRTTADPLELRRLALGIIKTASPAKPQRPPAPDEPTAEDLDQVLAALLAADPPRKSPVAAPPPAPPPPHAPSNHPAPLTVCTTQTASLLSHAGVAKPIENATGKRRCAHQNVLKNRNPP